MKKLFIISIISLVLALIFFISYNIAFKGRITPGNKEFLEEIKNGMSRDAKDKTTSEITDIMRLTQNPVIPNMTIDTENNKLRYFDKTEGLFKNISFDGSFEEPFPDSSLPKPSYVDWSSNNRYSIIYTGSGIYYYDHQDGAITKLKPGIDFATWDDVSNKIIYKYFDNETKKRSLNISNLDGTEWKQLAEIDFRKISIAPIPQSSLVSFWSYPDYNFATILKTVDPLNLQTKTLFKDRPGGDYLWSNDGNKLLLSYVLDGKLLLAISNNDGSSMWELHIPTFTSKCVWSSDNKNVFCAVPSQIPEGTKIPNDYNERKILTKDTFWKINTTTGEKKRLVELEDIPEEIDATSLLLSPSEDILFFINRHNDSIYRVSL